MSPPAIDRTSSNKRKKARTIGMAILAGLFVAAAVGGFVAGYVDGSSEAANGTTPVASMFANPGSGFWLITLAAAAVNVLSLWGAAKWYFNIDEAAQRAHLEAWFWGSSIAALLVTPFALASLLVPQAAWPFMNALDLNPTQTAIIGGAGFYMVLMAGYGVAWLAWWWRRR